MIPHDILQLISYELEPYFMITHKRMLDVYSDDLWYYHHLIRLFPGMNLPLIYGSYRKLYQRYLDSGDIYDGLPKCTDIGIIESFMTWTFGSENIPLIGSGIKIAQYGTETLILKFNGDLFSNNKLIQSNVVDISNNAFITKYKCYFWYETTNFVIDKSTSKLFFDNKEIEISIDNEPFTQVDNFRDILFSCTKTHLYYINTYTKSIKSYQTPSEIKKIIVAPLIRGDYISFSANILCQNNVLYRARELDIIQLDTNVDTLYENGYSKSDKTLQYYYYTGRGSILRDITSFQPKGRPQNVVNNFVLMDNKLYNTKVDDKTGAVTLDYWPTKQSIKYISYNWNSYYYIS